MNLLQAPPHFFTSPIKKSHCHPLSIPPRAALSSTPTVTSHPGAVIVGGGLSGLAAATHLSSISVPFLLLDSADSVGGRVRTDRLDSFLLDRGFQIFLTSLPELRRLLHFPSLRLQPFYPGALVFHSGEFHLLSDPFRLPLRSLSSLFNPIGSFPDKLLVAFHRLRAAITPDDLILSNTETSIYDHLVSLGFSHSMIDRFLRPFFAGIFFDSDLSTTSRLFDLVFKQLALGDNALPAAGIAAIPLQLADRLPQSSIRLNTRVVAVHPVTVSPASPASVTLDNGDIITADLGVIVAVDQPEAEKLLPQAFPSEPGGKTKRPPRRTTCLYFQADRAAIKDPILILNGSGKGIVNNMFFVTNVAPSYAPEGKVLVSVSLVGDFPERSDEDLTAEVVGELGGWFGNDEVSEWKHLRTYRIGFAQPNQTPPTDPIGRDPKVDEGVYMCGDHWTWATFDGALVAGRKAAETLVRDRKISAV